MLNGPLNVIVRILFCIVAIPINYHILQYVAVNASCSANPGALKIFNVCQEIKQKIQFKKEKKRKIQDNVNILNVSNMFQVFNQILPIERFL